MKARLVSFLKTSVNLILHKGQDRKRMHDHANNVSTVFVLKGE